MHTECLSVIRRDGEKVEMSHTQQQQQQNTHYTSPHGGLLWSVLLQTNLRSPIAATTMKVWSGCRSRPQPLGGFMYIHWTRFVVISKRGAEWMISHLVVGLLGGHTESQTLRLLKEEVSIIIHCLLTITFMEKKLSNYDIRRSLKTILRQHQYS